MHPSCEWLWLRVGVTEKRFVKMNYRVRNRNATTLRGESAVCGRRTDDSHTLTTGNRTRTAAVADATLRRSPHPPVARLTAGIRELQSSRFESHDTRPLPNKHNGGVYVGSKQKDMQNDL